MAIEPIAVTIVSGFLGSGKSTLLSTWLQDFPPGDTAAIVNERGDIGIDGELLADKVGRLQEITGRCVCCSGQAELIAALTQLAQSADPPKRIFVETSGAASPAGVLRGVAAPALRDALRVDGVVAVADASRLDANLKFDLAAEQLGFADVVVLSHVDRLSSEGAEQATKQVEPFAPAAVFAQSKNGFVSQSLDDLLSARNQALQLPKEGSGHATIEAVSMLVEGELEEEAFTTWVEEALAPIESSILRVKGILAISGVPQRVIVQGVSAAVDVQLGRPWDAAPRQSRMVVLGLGLDADALEAGFLRCANQEAATKRGERACDTPATNRGLSVELASALEDETGGASCQ